MKKLSLTIAFLGLFLVGQMGFASLDDEGPYLEIEEGHAANFFLLDAEELDVPLTGEMPSLMPLHGIITSNFGWRRRGRRKHRVRLHKGVDIAAPIGTPIVAPANGRVAFVGRKGGYGLTVVIEHNDDVCTLFAHNSEILVKEGQTVARGQQISEVGSTGRSTGPHLHYEVRVQGVPVNPSKFM